MAEVEIELHGAGAALGYKAAVWDSWDRSRKLFGLLYMGSPTVMSYGLDYFDPVEVVEEDRDRFYFDAGGNSRPIWCTRDELKRVFRELGLIDDD